MSVADPYADLGVQGAAIPSATPTAPKSRAPLGQAGAKTAWDHGSAILESYLAKTPGLSAADKNRKRDAFFNDPRIARIREAAATPISQRPNLTPVPIPIVRAPVPITTKRAEIQKVARQHVQARQEAAGMDDGVGNFLTALKGSILQGVNSVTMGAPNAIAAGAEKLLPSHLNVPGLGDIGTGNDTDTSYMDILRTIQAKNEAEGERNVAGNFIGNLMGSLPVAAAALPLAAAAVPTSVTRAAAASPIAAAVAKTIGGGAVGGGAGTLANGQDPVTGAAVGAVAAPVLGLGAKGLGWVGKKAANVLGLPNAIKILQSVTKATKEEISDRIAAWQAQGIEPTLFEVLPLADRNRISENLVGRSDATLEGTQRLVTERLGNIGPEMAARVETATAPARAAATQDLTDAMTAARGTPEAPVPEMPGDAAVAARATRSPIDMQAQRSREARAIMAPHDNQTMFNDINEILPPPHPELQPNGDVHEVPGDPAVAAMIRRKAGILQRKNSNEASGGITGRNVSDLLGELNDYANGPNVDADVARSAVQHIEEILDQSHPEFLTAHARMTDAFAARSRVAEGVNEGMNTRTRETIQNVTQPVRNAYGTDEGAAGRQLGQANQLTTDFAEAGPRKAISRVAALPNEQAAIVQNLGPDAASQIAETAASQTQGAQALAGLDRQTKTSPTTLGPDDLAAAALGLNPASMIRTKIAAIQKLTQAIGIPEAKARGLVELIFSTDPARRAQVVQMLNATSQGKSILAGVAQAIGIGSAAANVEGTTPDPSAPEPVPAAPAASPTGEPDPYADLGAEEAIPADAPTEEPTAEPSAAAAPAGPDPTGAMLDQLGEGQDPQMQELLRQIRASGAAPGQENVPHGRAVIQGLFPTVHITEDKRDPNSKLGRANPDSYHVKTDEAVDVRPIPGMSFEEFIHKIEAAGHTIIEKRDEVKHPVSYATGPHWHVVIA